MGDEGFASSRIQQAHATSARTQQNLATEKLSQYAILQDSAAEEFQQWGDLNAWNPLALARTFQTLRERVRDKGRHEESHKIERGEEEIERIEEVQGIAEFYERKNPELQARTLLLLRSRLTDEDVEEEILRKVQETYQDLSLADEALDFLVEASRGKTQEQAKLAKFDLNDRFGREISAGRNIGAQARAFSMQGLGSPHALRDLYRSITGNPREPHLLFQELFLSYPYEKMKTVIEFILHSLGADMKAKGPSIERAELQRLFSEARTMQAILGVFRFFRSRMPLITSAYQRKNLPLPSRLNFELLSRLFLKFIQERYPSSTKLGLLAKEFKLSDEELSQAILYVQLRDATRQVAPKLFRDEKHRQDFLLCLMEILEELEEKQEEKKKRHG